MRGKYLVSIWDNKLRYDLELERNITIIGGKSGSGKSTLFSYFEDLLKTNRDTGLHCNCRDKIVLLKEDSNWKDLISSHHNKIFISDEYVDYIQTKDFAKFVNYSDNYFIFITRSGRMNWLTYSIDSIYEFRTIKEDNTNITKLYNKYLNKPLKVKPSLIITEDSNSGYDAIDMLRPNCDIISAHGKDNVYNVIDNNIDDYSCIYVIVDGSAFGSCIGRIFPKFSNKEVYLFAPESFEFLLLLASTFKRYLTSELECTYNFCDSKDFISWERYYTFLLSRLCKTNYGFEYTKSKLSEFFKSDYFKNHLRAQISDIF